MKILRCFDCQLTVYSIWVPYFRPYTAGFPKRYNEKDRTIGITIERSPHINNKSLEMTTCKTQCDIESSFDFGKGHWLESQLVTFCATLLIADLNSASQNNMSASLSLNNPGRLGTQSQIHATLPLVLISLRIFTRIACFGLLSPLFGVGPPWPGPKDWSDFHSDYIFGILGVILLYKSFVRIEKFPLVQKVVQGQVLDWPNFFP